MRNAELQSEVARRAMLPCRFRISHSAFRIGGWRLISLAGKRAFVTGGGRGIGRATALLLARAGASVAVGYRERKKEAEETTEAVKAVAAARAVAVGGDLGDAAAARRAVGEAIGALGGPDLLIANNGVWPPQDVAHRKMTHAQGGSNPPGRLDAV